MLVADLDALGFARLTTRFRREFRSGSRRLKTSIKTKAAASLPRLSFSMQVPIPGKGFRT
jgi:hypothetical protein